VNLLKLGETSAQPVVAIPSQARLWREGVET